jgi:hypothetical protein
MFLPITVVFFSVRGAVDIYGFLISAKLGISAVTLLDGPKMTIIG